jgi:hypothetical protein
MLGNKFHRATAVGRWDNRSFVGSNYEEGQRSDLGDQDHGRKKICRLESNDQGSSRKAVDDDMIVDVATLARFFSYISRLVRSKT